MPDTRGRISDNSISLKYVDHATIRLDTFGLYSHGVPVLDEAIVKTISLGLNALSNLGIRAHQT